MRSGCRAICGSSMSVLATATPWPTENQCRNRAGPRKVRACELMRGKPHFTNFVIVSPSRSCRTSKGGTIRLETEIANEMVLLFRQFSLITLYLNFFLLITLYTENLFLSKVIGQPHHTMITITENRKELPIPIQDPCKNLNPKWFDCGENNRLLLLINHATK